jgi:putative heme iron utilization protein
MAKPKKPKSVFIATPMYGGMCHGSYAKSVFNNQNVIIYSLLMPTNLSSLKMFYE